MTKKQSKTVEKKPYVPKPKNCITCGNEFLPLAVWHKSCIYCYKPYKCGKCLIGLDI
jgi:hypothetical protein